MATEVVGAQRPNIVARVSLTAQAAVIGATTIYTPAEAGVYRGTAYIHTTATGTGSVTFAFAWNDGISAKTNGAVACDLTVTNSTGQKTLVQCIRAAAGQAITFNTTGSPGGTARYALEIVLEQLA
jgi:hypothetical protein